MGDKKEIVIRGLNQARLLTKLSKEGIVLYSINKVSPSEIRFFVRAKDEQKAIAIVENLCYTYTITKADGLSGKLLKRLWLPIAMLVFAGLIFASNELVWRIEVNGTSGVALVNVQRLIEERGIKPFTRKPQDIAGLRAEIMSLSRVSEASVVLDGCVLRIGIIETQATTPVEKGGSVASNYDGVVTRVITESGTPLVKSGDVVRRGQSLISGNLTASADGRVIVTAEPKGSVYGDVTFAFSTVVSNGYEWQATGQTQIETSVGLFGFEWEGKQCRFDNYQVSVTTSDFFCFRVVRTTYTEIESQSASADIEEFKNAKLGELERVYMTEFDIKYIIEDKGGLQILRMYCTAEMCLGKS